MKADFFPQNNIGGLSHMDTQPLAKKLRKALGTENSHRVTGINL